MHKNYRSIIISLRQAIKYHIGDFFKFFAYYLKKRIIGFSTGFEKNKNRLVKFFIMKRGRYNRPFLHLTTMGVLGVGVLIAPYLADTLPVFTKASAADLSILEARQQSIIIGENVFQTDVSEKPRDKILTYTVEKGDTVSTIAHKFGISSDSVLWENNLTFGQVYILF